MLSMISLIISTVLFLLFMKDKKTQQIRMTLFDGLWDKQMWLLGITWCFITMTFAAYITWAGTIFVEHYALYFEIAFFLASIIVLANLPLNPIIGIISDRVNKRKLFIIISTLLMSISLLGGGNTSETPNLILMSVRSSLCFISYRKPLLIYGNFFLMLLEIFFDTLSYFANQRRK